MLKFDHNLGADRDRMRIKFGGAQSANFRGQNSAFSFQRPKISKKWIILKRYISVTTYINEKKFVFFELTAYDLYHGHIHVFRLG